MAIKIRFEIAAKPDKGYLFLDGQLDVIGAPVFEKSINDVLRSDVKTLVLNLRDLDFVASVGLRVFAKWQKIMQQRNGRLLFLYVQPQVKKVLDIVKAVRISDIFVNDAELDAYLEAMQRESD